MVKALVYDDSVHLEIENLVSSCDTNAVNLGVIAGQPTAKQDIVLLLALTPPNAESKCGNSLDEGWCSQHAKQVNRMLPGGVDVLGLFVVASSVNFEKNKIQIKQALVSVHKAMLKTRQLSDYPHRPLLHIDPSLKISCRSIDMSNPSSTGSPCDVKQLKNSTAFNTIRCQLSLQYLAHLDNDVCTLSLLKQMSSSLDGIRSEIDRSKVFIGGLLNDESAPLSNAIKAVGDVRDVTVEMVVPMHKPSVTPEGTSLAECGASVDVIGTMELRACLNQRATFGEAVACIKQDAIRSLNSRCAMHCEDLMLIEDEQFDPSMVHELPKRVFSKSTFIPFCDYVFHGDDGADCLQAFKEILGVELSPSDIDSNCEQSPIGDQENIEGAQVEELINEATEQLQKGGAANVALIALSVSVALLAVLLTYLFFRS